MKVAVPVTINDSNMTSDAVDETYPVWGGGVYQAVAYGTTPPELLTKVVVDETTGDMWGFSGSSTRRVYKKASADAAFSIVATIGDAGDTIRDIAVDYSGYVYIIYSDYSAVELSVYRIHPVTYEVIGPICSVATDLEIVSLALDTFLGDIFFSAGANIYKYTNATGVTAVHYTVAETAVVSLAFDPSNKNIYAGTMTPYNILKQTASAGAFAEIASDVDYVYGVAVNWYAQDLFCYSQEVGVVAEIFHLPSGETAFVSLGDAPYRIGGMSCDRGTLYFTYESRLSLGVFSDKAFLSGSYAIYNGGIYLALADSAGVAPGTDTTKWFRYSAVNHLKMFDGSVEAKTTATGSLAITVEAANVTALAFFGVLAETLSVTLTVDAAEVFTETKILRSSEVGDWYEYFFEPINQISTAVFTDIPAYGTGTFEIVFTGSSVSDPVECALCVGGYAYDIGTTKRNVKPRIMSHSTQTTDAFGRMAFVQRNSAKRVEGDAFVSSRAEFQRIFDLMDQIRDTPCLWLVSRDLDTWSILHGVYQKFEPIVNNDNGSYSFEILEVL